MFQNSQNQNNLFWGVFSLLCPIVIIGLICFGSYSDFALFEDSAPTINWHDPENNWNPFGLLFALTLFSILGTYFGSKCFLDNRNLKSIGFWALLINILFLSVLLIAWGASI